MPQISQIVEHFENHLASDTTQRTENSNTYITTGLAVSIIEYSSGSKYLASVSLYISGASAIDSVQFRASVDGTVYEESPVIVVGNRNTFFLKTTFKIAPSPVVGAADFLIEFKAVVGTITLENNVIPGTINIQESYINDFT